MRQPTAREWPDGRGNAGGVEAAEGAPPPMSFGEWLGNQLKAQRMSQRSLAQRSGVNHSTISRILNGGRAPSFDTATKLARALHALGEDTTTPHDPGGFASAPSHPTARVEYALRSDDLLGEPQVKQVMEYYLAVRVRHAGRV